MTLLLFFLKNILENSNEKKKPFIIFSDWDDTIVDNLRKPNVVYRNVSKNYSSDNITRFIQEICKNKYCLGFYIVSHRGANDDGLNSLQEEASLLNIEEYINEEYIH